MWENILLCQSTQTDSLKITENSFATNTLLQMSYPPLRIVWPISSNIEILISGLSHQKKFPYSCPELLTNDFITLSLLIFRKSPKFESCGGDPVPVTSKILGNSSMNFWKTPWWCCHAWDVWLFYLGTPTDALMWGSWHAWEWFFLSHWNELFDHLSIIEKNHLNCS